MTDPARVDAYRAAADRVRARIAEACARTGRDPDDVTLVAVSKTVPAEALRDAVAAGLDLLGENRVQEAAGKVADVPGARWHLVGPLQSNKARRAVEVFDAVQSVDSVELGGRLARLAEELRPGAVFDLGSAKVSKHMLLFEPSGGQMVVNESYIFSNDGKTAWYDPTAGTLKFSAPNVVGKVSVTANAPGGMPIPAPVNKTSKADGVACARTEARL